VAEPNGTVVDGGRSPTTRGGGEPGERSGGSPRSGRNLAVLVVLTVAVVVLLGLGAMFGINVVQADMAQARRDVALQTAREFAHDLSALDHRTADRDVQRLLDGSTKQFAEQFGISGPAFTDVMKQTRLVSTGEVTSAGVERMDADSARVLVAVRAVVRDAELPEGTPRNYRLSIDLMQTGDRWLVSRVEFIL
jgi:Mce-associated membrane protein